MSTSFASDVPITLEEALAQINLLNLQNQSLQQQVQSLEARESQLQNEILELKASTVTPPRPPVVDVDDDDELNQLMIASSKKEKQKRKDIDDDLDSLDAAVKIVEEGKGNKKIDPNVTETGNSGQAADEGEQGDDDDDDHDQEDHEPRHRAYDEEDEELEKQKRKREKEQEQQNGKRSSTSLHRKQQSREQVADDLAVAARVEGSSIDAGFLESRQRDQTMEGGDFTGTATFSASDENNIPNNDNERFSSVVAVVPNKSDPTSKSQLPASDYAATTATGSQQNLFAWMLASQILQNAKSANDNNGTDKNNNNNDDAAMHMDVIVTSDNDSISHQQQQQQISKVSAMNANVFQYTPSMTSSTGGESQLSSPASMMHQLTVSNSSNNNYSNNNNNAAITNNPQLLHPNYFVNNSFNVTLPLAAVGSLQPLASLQLQVENNSNYLSSTHNTNNNRVIMVHPSRNNHNNGASDEQYTLLLENPSVADYLSAEDSRRFSLSTSMFNNNYPEDSQRDVTLNNTLSETQAKTQQEMSPLSTTAKDLNENSATLVPKNGEKASPDGASAEIGEKKEKKTKTAVVPTVQYPENTRCFKTQTRIEKSRSVAVTASYSDILMTMINIARADNNNNNNNQQHDETNNNLNAPTTHSSLKNVTSSSGSLPNGSLGSSMGLQESMQSNSNNNVNSRSVSAGNTTTGKKFFVASSSGSGTSRNQDCDNADDCGGEETPRTSDSLSSTNVEIQQQQQQQQQKQATVATLVDNDEKEFILASAQLAQEHLDRLQGLLDHVNSVVVKSTNLASRSVSCTNNGEK